jgi:hypothetical protein
MENVIFTPWVGKDYYNNENKNKRIMVLGESHYCNRWEWDEKHQKECWATKEKKCNERDFHINLLLDYYNADDKRGKFHIWFRTFTKFTNVFSGKKCEDKEKISFWNSVVFYNYVQTNIE